MDAVTRSDIFGAHINSPTPCTPPTIASSTIVSQLSELATEVVSQARKYSAEGLLNPKKKNDGSWITDADLASHRFLSERLPLVVDVPVLSEEGYPDFRSRSDWRNFWLIDPIDNTQGLVEGNLATSSVSIVLIIDGAPRLALVAYLDGDRSLQVQGDIVSVHTSSDGLRYLTSQEAAAPLRFVSYRASLGEMSDLTRSALAGLGVQEQQLVARERLYQRFWAVLNGEADVYLEPRSLPGWDVAPHICGCLAQGGTAISLLTGKQLNYNSKDMMVGPFIVGRRGVDTGEIQRRAKIMVR